MALKLLDGFGDFGIKFINLFNTLTATVNNLAAGTPPGTYTPGNGVDINGSNEVSADFASNAQTETGASSVLVTHPAGVGAAIDAALDAFKLDIYPIGAVYTSVASTTPATLFGGTWSSIAAGRVLVGRDGGDSDFNTAEETGGAKTHQLTAAEMPSHAHGYTRPGWVASGGSDTMETANDNMNFDASYTTGSSGSNGAHNNVQPYFVVYMWKRTA